MAIASVIIPAHNEAAVIRRCLSSLLAGAADGEIEAVVVCNGCSDGTAAVAQGYPSSGVTVVELTEASKSAALNRGDESCQAWPRFYVDADVEMDIGSLRSTVAVLDAGGVLVAAPVATFALRSRSWPIRAFYEVWTSLPYLNNKMVGTGVYALSEEGRARFERFPSLTADDQFVMQLFADDERASVRGATFVVHPPSRLRGLLAMRTRAYRGNAELARSGLALAAPPAGAKPALLRLARSPRWWPPLAVYLGVNLVAKGRARWLTPTRWDRDDSARSIAR